MIKKLVSYFLYVVLKGISFLPLSEVLYAFGFFVYILLFHILGYRRTTVNTNLSLCFPEKSSAELTYIEKNFYKHFTQIIIGKHQIIFAFQNRN
jgi:KDO2-lipid IV(A) lauroyltransferase